MERRLIDANALKRVLVAVRDDYAAEGSVIREKAAVCAIKFLENERISPTIDAVEVVRCRDCKHYREYSEDYKATVENADGDCAIRKWRSDDEQFCAVTKDDYCSLGERREPDGE